MARKEIMICDRCALEVEPGKGGRIEIIIDGRGGELDLCVKCCNVLEFWLNNPNSPAPPGYKLQPRPCPHHIPCADPNGCSGQELVPV